MSRKLLFLVTLPVLLFAGSVTHSFTFSVADLSFSKLDGYDVISLAGCAHTNDAGRPLLPQKAAYLLVPADAEVTAVKALVEDSVVLSGRYLPYLAQAPRKLSEATRREAEPPRPAERVEYGSDPWPGRALGQHSTGVKSEYRVCGVLLNPMQYHPIARTLVLYTRIRIEAAYVEGKLPKGYSPRGVLTQSQRDRFGCEVARLVANPEDVKTFAPGTRASDDGEVDYLVITGPQFMSALQPFCDWKTEKGFRTEMRSTTWVSNQYPGRDLPEKIRNAVLDYYCHRGLAYLLLAGDVAVVPCRQARAIVGGEVGDIPSDLYFADLQGSWDGNHNDIFGEADGDSVDLFADIFVGRASIDRVSEANTFVNKVLAYEREPDPTYLKKLLLPSGWLWREEGYHGRVVNDAIAALTPSDWFDANLVDPPSAVVVGDSVDQGFAFAHPCGHGNEGGIYDQSGRAIYLTTQAQAQTNGLHKLCIMNSIACHSGNFEYSDCVAEAAMNCPSGGAVAVMMNSRYGWGTPPVMGPSELLDLHFYDEYFSGDSVEIGVVHARGLDYYREQAMYDGCWRWCIYGLNLLGDPLLPLWHGPPQSLSVSYTDTIHTGWDTVGVQVQAGGPIANARVCARKGNEVFSEGFTNSSGIVRLAINAAVPGSMSLLVSAPECLPFEGSVTVMPGTPLAYLAYESYRVDDAGQVNPNYCLEHGEHDRVYVTLRNLGNLAAGNTVARLRALNSFLLVTDSLADYGTIGAGAAAEGDGFVVAVLSNAPWNTLLDLVLSVESDQGSWTAPFSVYVGFPGLVVADIDSCAALLSVTGIGALGYDRRLPGAGKGFRYLQTDTSRLGFGSFLFGTGPDYLVDGYYGQPTTNTCSDWRLRDSLRYCVPLWGGNQQVFGTYDDAGLSSPRNVEVRQSGFAVNRPGYDDFVILVYDITNRGSSHLEPAYAGLAGDFDVVPTDKLHDRARANPDAKAAYMWNALTVNPTVGVRLLSSGPLSNAAVIDPARYYYPDSALTDGMKFRFLNGGIAQREGLQSGNWSVVVATGPFTLDPGVTQRVAFAVAGGADSTAFLAHGDSAQSWYDRCVGIDEGIRVSVLSPMTGINVRPNPTAGPIRIAYQVRIPGRVTISLVDAAGRVRAKVLEGHAASGVVSWQPRGLGPGVYFVKLDTGAETVVAKLLLLGPVAHGSGFEQRTASDERP